MMNQALLCTTLTQVSFLFDIMVVAFDGSSAPLLHHIITDAEYMTIRFNGREIDSISSLADIS